MKFSCERCGKKYATAEDPAPGRVYKLRCKACGHLIVVKASAFAASAPEAAAAGTPAEPHPLPPPLELRTPEPSLVPANGGGDGPRSLDTTTEVPAAAMTAPSEPGSPPPSESGYVDLFSDVGSGSTELPRQAADDPFYDSGSVSAELPQRPSDDPFLAAARASLPDTYGSDAASALDPLSGLRDDISATSAPEPAREPPPIVKVPVIPKPKQEKSPVPLALIGVGVLALVGILAFALMSSSRKATAPAPPAPVAAAVPAPVAPAVPAPAPEPPPEAAAAAPAASPEATPPPAPQKAPDAEQRARAEQRRKDRDEAQARARAEREAKDRERAERAKAEREARAQRERDARLARERAAAEERDRERVERQRSAAEKAQAEPEGGLTQAQIETVLRSTKPAFDGCIQTAKSSDVKLDGRRVMLRLNIQTSGTVTYPTLDDVTLAGTDLGSCLKSAARLMVFPKFKGDTMHVEVPLVMR